MSGELDWPEHLPPLPALPDGFDRWVYRGIKYASPCAIVVTSFDETVDEDWDPPAMFQTSGHADTHYAQAVSDRRHPEMLMKHHRICKCVECLPVKGPETEAATECRAPRGDDPLGCIEALAVRQPFAWLITQGKKRFENRDWSRWYPPRCRVKADTLILIHASAGMTRREYDEGYALAKEYDIELPAPHDLERGGIVGWAVMKRWHDSRPNLPFAFGSGIEFSRTGSLTPTSCKGRLGFFRPQFADLSDAQRLLRELEVVEQA